METAGQDIILLEIGEPDFATPAPIIEAGIAGLRAGHTHDATRPTRPARDHCRVLCHTLAGRGRSSSIVVTSGASGALLLTLHLLAGPYAEVLSERVRIHG